MRKTRIRLFMQVEFETCRDKCEWLLRCHHCVANNCPEEYCPPTPISIPPDYAKTLIERWKMTRKGILPPNIKMVLKTHYPLLCAEPELPGNY